MEVRVVDPNLVSLLRKANKTLRRKDYSEALEKYCECLRMIPQDDDVRTPTIEDLELSIYSLRGVAYSGMMNYYKADQDFSYVLRHRSFEPTTLIRRASMNLKLKEYRKAVSDIGRLIQIEPESIRVAALLLQTKGKLAKLEDSAEREDLMKALDEISNVDAQDLDEEEMLNFCNLRKIDRKSIRDVTNHTARVSFTEDKEEVYEAVEDYSEEFKPNRRFSSIDIQNILNQQEKDFIEPDAEKIEPKVSIVCKALHKKSILKSNSRILSQPESSASEISKQPTLNALEVKDIDGKPIRNSVSKVRFRKSEVINLHQLPLSSNISKPPSRKSCLKQSLFGSRSVLTSKCSQISTASPTALTSRNSSCRSSRSSSFIGLNMDNVDGRVVRSVVEARKKDKKDGDNSSSSDSGDEHDIFGGGNEFELLDKVMTQVLGDEDNSNKNSSLRSSAGKKSILKKSSLVGDTSDTNELEDLPQPALKTKKSVLFK